MTKRMLSLLLLLSLLTTLVAGCVQPAPMAPAESAAPVAEGAASAAAPGEIQPGGTWTRVTIADASIINPILSSDSASSAVEAMLFPGLIGQDPVTGEFTPNGSMSESWTVSEDGLTWTFKLREGITWSDGDPVDAADFKFTYDAIASDLVETVRKSLVEPIESITVVDPLTVEVKFREVRCDAISNVGLGWLPSHLYATDFSDIMTSPLNEEPSVSAGPFAFQSWTRDDNTILVRNETYWEGAPNMDGMIYARRPRFRCAPGATAQRRESTRYWAGAHAAHQPSQGNPDITVYQRRRRRLRLHRASTRLTRPTRSPARTRTASLIRAGSPPHPGRPQAVRQAIAHALDYQIRSSTASTWASGYQIAANVLPAVELGRTTPSMAPYDYDPELGAPDCSEGAGWVDSNGDGIREKDGNTI
jgi:peptide/nickel transport system substrate-binding protein